jgi:hypothetical protein
LHYFGRFSGLFVLAAVHIFLSTHHCFTNNVVKEMYSQTKFRKCHFDPRCICSFYLENKFQNFKKIRKKYLHVDLHILCVYARFRSKQTFFLAFRKKICRKKAYFGTNFFHFYTGNIKSQFSLKRFCRQLGRGNVHKTFLFAIF